MSLVSSKIGKYTIQALCTVFILSTVLFVALSILPSHATPASQTWTVVAGMESEDFAIQGDFYAPSDISVHMGDTLKWVVQSHDIHTVTFPPKGQTLPQFNPTDPKQVQPQGGSTYDGSSYFNSGLLALGSPATTYSLVMGVTGNFDYYCLVHGTMMHGVVHVLSATAQLPQSQNDVRIQIVKAKAQLLAEGGKLEGQARETVAKKHIVLVGIGSMTEVGMVEVVRFFPSKIRLHVGQNLTFMSGAMMPHTFTIGNDEDPFTPVGDASNYTGGVFNRFVPPGSSFTLTVTAAVDVPFSCQFHDNLGMDGELIAE